MQGSTQAFLELSFPEHPEAAKYKNIYKYSILS